MRAVHDDRTDEIECEPDFEEEQGQPPRHSLGVGTSPRFQLGSPHEREVVEMVAERPTSNVSQSWIVDDVAMEFWDEPTVQPSRAQSEEIETYLELERTTPEGLRHLELLRSS